MITELELGWEVEKGGAGIALRSRAVAEPGLTKPLPAWGMSAHHYQSPAADKEAGR